jgi:hypothetical protein
MHPFNLAQGTVRYRVPRVGTSVMLLALGCWGGANLARVMPGIIGHVARSCAGCYSGPFQSPLDPYRIPAGQSEDSAAAATTPLALKPLGTAGLGPLASKSGGAGDWLALTGVIAAEPTSVVGIQRVNLWRGQNTGRLARELPAGVDGAWEASGFAADLTGRAAPGGNTMAQTNWTSVPAGHFADHHLDVLSISGSANQAEGQLAFIAGSPNPPRNDSLPAQGSDGRDLSVDERSAVGVAQTAGLRGIQGSVPYWRVAVQKDLQQHFLQIGTYGLNAATLPDRGRSAGSTEAPRDLVAEADYQFILDPGSAVRNVMSAHSDMVHESRSLDAGNRTNGIYTIDTFRADLSWAIADTVTPSIQYFRNAGSIEAMPNPWPGARPNSAGVIAGIIYMPWNGAGSPIQFLNLRIAAQYVAYTEVNGNGNGHGSGGNNGVHLSLWGALHF